MSFFQFDHPYISELLSRLSITPDRERAIFLAQKNRGDYIYSSVFLEGNPYTFPEVQTLLSGITVGGRRLTDTDQVLAIDQAHSRLIEMVKTGDFTLESSTACGIQSIVARGEALSLGRFRDGMVYINGTDYTPPPAQVLDTHWTNGMKEILYIVSPILRAMACFLWMSREQFFYDGNKRTARLIANGILLDHGYPELLIRASDQLEYNTHMIDWYTTGDMTTTLEWLITGVYHRELDRGGFLST